VLPSKHNDRRSDDGDEFVSARKRLPVALAVLALPLLLSACSQGLDKAGMQSMLKPNRHHGYSDREKECLMRAMFFESHRSSRDGMIAVGTVVMNRVRSGKWGSTICEVVSAKRQFAPGVMTRKMNSKALPDVEAAAEAVLKGERHAKVKNSMFFHTAGLKFGYNNMQYTIAAGGNVFYEKRKTHETVELPPEKGPVYALGTFVDTPRTTAKTDRVQPAAKPAVETVMVAAAEVPAQAAQPPQATTATAAPVQMAAAVPAAAPEEASVQAATPPAAAEPAAVQVAEAEFVLPMAINGPTPTARPEQPTLVAAFPDAPRAPAQRVARAPEAAPEPVAAAPKQVVAAAAQEKLPFGFAEASADTAALVAAPAFAVDQSDADAIGALIVGGESNLSARMY
jgi:hypothetical protein